MFMDTKKNLIAYENMCKKYNIDNIIELAKDHKIPNHITIGGNGMMDLNYFDECNVSSVLLREDYRKYSGFMLLDDAIVTDIANVLNGKRVLEVGSGSGALASCLQDKGIDVTPTDNYSWVFYFDHNNLWTDIEEIDVKDAISKYGNNVDVILMSWPTAEFASKALEAIQDLRKQHLQLCYAGEEFGCCAGNDFFESDILDYDKRKYVYGKDGESNYNRWPGLYDNCFICDILL